jgi:hypothetical protein
VNDDDRRSGESVESSRTMKLPARTMLSLMLALAPVSAKA